MRRGFPAPLRANRAGHQQAEAGKLGAVGQQARSSSIRLTVRTG